MKKLILFSLVTLYACTASSQETEFTIHDNGLIYDEQTMSRLGHIVDSLNLKFKTCEPKQYRSLQQGFATIIELNKTDIPEARKAMNNNMALETFLKQFPRANHYREWIVKSRYTNYNDKRIIKYATLPLRQDARFILHAPDSKANDKHSGWVFHEEDGDLVGLYLEDVQARPVPVEYAQLIQYVDCMIDTTARIYLNESREQIPQKLPPDSKIIAYLSFADDFKGEPKMPEMDWDNPSAEAVYKKYKQKYQQWENARIARVDEKMQKGHYYKSLLIDAAREAIERGTGDPDLEFYVERYLDPAQALRMKRLRQPVGMCSQDRTPRLHAQSICRLAAETTQWDIFLRAHLDIMNDNFQRSSDGSYAWAGRGTYLRELEELDINAPDLLIGTSLRASNVCDDHYFGDIGRVGRALAETKNKEDLERRLLSMIKDENLDLFNRLLMAYLFDNYNYHLQDEARKKNNDSGFVTAVATLPDGIGKSFHDKP